MNIENRTQLLELAKWSRIVAILIYFIFGVYVIYFVFVLKRLFRLSDSVNDLGILLGFLNVYYMVAGMMVVLLFLIPNTRLFQFSGYLEAAVVEDNETLLQSAFSKLKSSFKFSGISLMVIAVLVAIMGCWWLSIEV